MKGNYFTLLIVARLMYLLLDRLRTMTLNTARIAVRRLRLMGNKIEVGCLAIVLGGDWGGREVRVLFYMGDNLKSKHPLSSSFRDWWRVEPVNSLPNDDLYPNPSAPEIHLMRIDGDTQIEEEEAYKELKGTY